MSDHETSPASSSPPTTLNFTTSPQPLREIASAQAAFLLWRLKIQSRPAGEIPTTQWFQKQNFTAKDFGPQAFPIQDLIDPHIKSIGTDLREWVEYHTERIFFDSPPHSVIWKSFDRLKFQHDGTLDYVTTAQNLISCNRLSRNDKYRLACCYCFEENVRQMWPTFYINQYTGVSNSASKSMIKYWSKHMLCELRGKREQAKEVIASAKRKLSAVYKYPRNWTSVEYFFNKLNPDEKPGHMIDLIDFSILYAIYLLPKLTQSQIRTVMEKKGFLVWIRFSKEFKYSEYAIQTWNYIRYFTSQDTFYNMIKLTVEEQLLKMQTKTNNKFVISLLYETWINAPDHLKKGIVSSYISSIVQISFEGNEDMFHVINQDNRFFLEIFSEISFDQRGRLWDQYSSKMIVSMRPKYLHRLFELCIGDDQQIAEYKRTFLSDPSTYKNLKKHSIEWVKKGEYTNFDELSAVFSSDKEATIKLKQDVLISCDNLAHDIFQLNNQDKWYRFRVFVDAAFTDPEIGRGYKKCFAYSYRLRQDLSSALNRGRLQDVINFLDLFLKQDDFNELKRDIFDECYSNLMAGRIYNFTASNWQKFFEWCLGSDTEIAEFKVPIPTNDIFAVCVEKYVRFNSKYDIVGANNQECYLITLNHFLMWYFDSKELVKEYKLNKISSYNGIKSIREKFQTENDQVIEKLVDWFFDGDAELINKWNNPLSANIPPFVANVMNILKKKWTYCGDI